MTAGVVQTLASASDRERLAGRAAAKHIGRVNQSCAHHGWQDGHVAVVGDLVAPFQAGDGLLGAGQRMLRSGRAEAVRQHLRRCDIDFGEPRGPPAERVPSYRSGLDARTHGAESKIRLKQQGAVSIETCTLATPHRFVTFKVTTVSLTAYPRPCSDGLRQVVDQEHLAAGGTIAAVIGLQDHTCARITANLD